MKSSPCAASLAGSGVAVVTPPEAPPPFAHFPPASRGSALTSRILITERAPWKPLGLCGNAHSHCNELLLEIGWHGLPIVRVLRKPSVESPNLTSLRHIRRVDSVEHVLERARPPPDDTTRPPFRTQCKPFRIHYDGHDSLLIIEISPWPILRDSSPIACHAAAEPATGAAPFQKPAAFASARKLSHPCARNWPPVME